MSTANIWLSLLALTLYKYIEANMLVDKIQVMWNVALHFEYLLQISENTKQSPWI